MTNEQTLVITQFLVAFWFIPGSFLSFVSVALLTSGAALSGKKLGRLILGAALAGATVTLMVLFSVAYLQRVHKTSLGFDMALCVLPLVPGFLGFIVADWFHGKPFTKSESSLIILTSLD